MPTVAGLSPGYTERVEGTSGREVGVFREAVPLRGRVCRPAANSMLLCGDSHPEGREPRPVTCRSAARGLWCFFVSWIMIMSSVFGRGDGMVLLLSCGSMAPE